MTPLNLKTIAAISFVLVLLLILRSLQSRSRASNSRLNFDDLLLGADGKWSKAATVMLGSFAVTTWGLVYVILSGKDAYPYYWAYCLTWAAPAVTALIVSRPQDNVTVAESTTTSTTKIATPTPGSTP